jgi:hypothetical protein
MDTRNYKRLQEKNDILQSELNMYKKRKLICPNCDYIQETPVTIPNIMLPVPLPFKAHKFLINIGVHIPESNLMSRFDFTTHIYDYIKENNLYYKNYKHLFIVDSKIGKLFSLNIGELLTYALLNNNLYKLYKN